MKRIYFKLCAVLLVVLTPLSLQAGIITYTANYDSGNMTTGTDTLGGVTYTTVQYEGLYNYGEPGMPSLPMDYIHFSVPWNATNFNVQTSTSGSNTIRYFRNLVYPCQPPRMMCDTTPVVITLPDMNAYADYPQQKAWVVDEGFLVGDNHIVTVAVMPVSFSSSTLNVLTMSPTVQLTLSYQLSNSPAMYPISRDDAALRQEGYALTQSMVVNPTNVENNAPFYAVLDSLSLIVPDLGNGLNGGVNPGSPIADDSIYSNFEYLDYYPYVIVTTNDYYHSLRRLVALKKQKGYNVKVVTMDEVLNNPFSSQGDVVNNVLTYTDNAGKLRQFLRNYYKRCATKYVLLAGNGVPYRLKHFYKTDAPSDLYFSDLTANWFIGKIDKKPELFVGRILANNTQQIHNYTNKLLRYELNPGNGNWNYLKRALFTEGHDMHKEYNLNTNIIRQLLSIYPDTIIMREDTSGVRFPTGVDIVNELNAYGGYGYLSFHSHGSPSGLITYGYRKDNNCPNDTFRFLWAIDSVRIHNGTFFSFDLPSGNGLNCLTNKSYPSICYSIACEVMPFDIIPNYEQISMNFGESFTTGKNYGGPAFLGNTRDGYIRTSSDLEKCFIQQIKKGKHKLGEAEAWSKVALNGDKVNYEDSLPDKYYFSCVHNLLGDPEFEIWTDIPQQYSNITITRTNDSIKISGNSVNSSIVAIYNNGGQVRQLIADSSNITLKANPNSTIMLYKHNYIPFIAPLVLQNTNLAKNQYVIASDVIAGSNVDSGRTDGDVIVPNGVEYEIEASGTVTLQDGFKVEKGATFAVYPSSF